MKNEFIMKNSNHKYGWPCKGPCYPSHDTWCVNYVTDEFRRSENFQYTKSILIMYLSVPLCISIHPCMSVHVSTGHLSTRLSTHLECGTLEVVLDDTKN